MTDGERMSWGSAVARALIAVVASVALFVLVPDRLLAYLSVHIVPFWRDLMMMGYVAVAFAVGCWMFMRLQRARS
jgi:hypothetical protein